MFIRKTSDSLHHLEIGSLIRLFHRCFSLFLSLSFWFCRSPSLRQYSAGLEHNSQIVLNNDQKLQEKCIMYSIIIMVARGLSRAASEKDRRAFIWCLVPPANHSSHYRLRELLVSNRKYVFATSDNQYSKHDLPLLLINDFFFSNNLLFYGMRVCCGSFCERWKKNRLPFQNHRWDDKYLVVYLPVSND